MNHQHFLHIRLLILLAFILASCRATAPVVGTAVHNIIDVYHERKDSVVSFEPDSATMRMLFECDSAGNVLMRTLEQEQGKRLSLEAQLKRTAAGTMVEIDCKQDSLQKVIEGLHERLCMLQNQSETKVVRERYIPTFHKVCAWIVCIAVAVLVLWLIVWIAVRCRRI